MGFSEYYQETRHTNGIYALKKGDDIVYIGSSMDIYTRILEHKADGVKDFDTVSSIERKDGDDGTIRKIIEMGVICELKPKYNKIYFDDYILWLFSLPSVEIKQKHIKGICKDVDNIVSKLYKGGHYEHKING